MVGSLKKRIEHRDSIENIPRSSRKPTVTAREYRRLERLVKSNRRDSLQDITTKFNENRDRPLAKRTLQFHLHKHGFRRRVARKKLTIREVNRRKRLSWCREKRKLTVEGQWKIVIFSDESKIVVGKDSRIYIWRKRGKGWRPDLAGTRRVKPCFELMIWGCITWYGVGTLTARDLEEREEELSTMKDELSNTKVELDSNKGQLLITKDTVHKLTQDIGSIFQAKQEISTPFYCVVISK
ncbi:uncharacterized protein LOC132724940 [Ruditapes philippinarum]|uniref:uncharacterized protein LOC132724940 n=1 Tax=Ruditapes philippinarum TaxID=129788 RepID=UPI00295B7A74|nr:uncharacterized protein LOC132724940 [Ruditapes philippinarum]